MAVLPRSSGAPGTDGQISSPRVATRTVVGMVLGILCLFTMVLSYQLMSCPCRRRKAKAAKHRTPRTSPSTHTPSKKPTRSFIDLKRLYQNARERFHRTHAPALGEKQSLGTSSPRGVTLRSLFLAATKPLRAALHRTKEEQSSPSDDTARPPNLRERRALRSLYLNTRTPTTPTTKRYPCNPPTTPTTPTRKRMAGLLHLSIGGSPDSPDTLSPFTPRNTQSRRLYQKLNDTAYSDWSNEESYRTERPISALISPWFPSEYEFPYPSLHSPGLTPATPPPLYPPPPAYIPEVPLRSPGGVADSPGRRAEMTEMKRESPPLVMPMSPIVSTLTEEIASDIVAWTALHESPSGVGALPEHRVDGVFVIANEDSEDEASNRDSMSTVYTQESGTWEAFEE
ncbi:uncharacterized protein TRAVEDRAFT_24626 [Trametes versicolor FP-101664 SS1]|uniref:uncharacterized protein n=1 Tax=Trametes versicolor (strain FP-101664) TaxID=717944 RepID=UPI0004623BB8|nr:uncharacterized protein TRAVEDRAFT_24626 [Trametes versicolor FP-101664 SS1]EIW52427.1 hypothetical protein TRAVEDRAFT_24626 [Trametes versicolor FP-101664 SS1]